MAWADFEKQLLENNQEVRIVDKIFWEISRCSDRHSDYMLVVMEQFDKLSNEEKIELVQMLWGSLQTNRDQLKECLRNSGNKFADPSTLKPEYFFGSNREKWE